MNRPSADHETRRAMKVGRVPKSVRRRIDPSAVESAHMLVATPSLNVTASHFPSGDQDI